MGRAEMDKREKLMVQQWKRKHRERKEGATDSRFEEKDEGGKETETDSEPAQKSGERETNSERQKKSLLSDLYM